MLRTLPYYVATGPGADGALCGLDPGPPASAAGGGGLPGLREGPWFWLVLAGLALMIAALVTTALLESHEPGGVYQAPHYLEGEIAPGRMVS